MPNLQRANVLAVKLLLRQRITSLRTDPLHLDCAAGEILWIRCNIMPNVSDAPRKILWHRAAAIVRHMQCMEDT